MEVQVPEGMRVVVVPENATVLVADARADGAVIKAADIAAAQNKE